MSEKSVAQRRYTNEFRLRPSGLPKQPGSMKRRSDSGCPWRVRPPSAKAQANAAPDGEVAAIHRKHRGSMAAPLLSSCPDNRGYSQPGSV